VADEIFDKATWTLREAETKIFQHLVELKAFDVIKSVIGPFATIRNMTARINVIKKTSYIKAVYSLVDSMTVIILVLMTLSKWSLDEMWYTAVSYTVIISFVFAYLWLLVRRLEDPFENSPGLINFNHKTLTNIYSGEEKVESEKIYFYNGMSRVCTLDMQLLTRNFAQQLRELQLGVRHPAAAPPPNLPTVPVKTGIGKTKRVWKIKALVRRGRIIAWSLLVVTVMMGCRLAVWYGGKVGGWVDAGVFKSFIGAVIFVCMILIQGVVSDYKEAEKTPSELFAALQALTAAVQVQKN
jgi:hypothetical protein